MTAVRDPLYARLTHALRTRDLPGLVARLDAPGANVRAVLLPSACEIAVVASDGGGAR